MLLAAVSCAKCTITHLKSNFDGFKWVDLFLNGENIYVYIAYHDSLAMCFLPPCCRHILIFLLKGNPYFSSFKAVGASVINNVMIHLRTSMFNNRALTHLKSAGIIHVIRHTCVWKIRMVTCVKVFICTIYLNIIPTSFWVQAVCTQI